LKKIAEADDILIQKNIDSSHEQEYEHEHGDNKDSNNTNTDTVTKAESSYAFAPQNLIHLDTQKLLDILHLGIPTNKEIEEHKKDLNTNNNNDDDAAVYSVPNRKERSQLINEIDQSLHTFHCGSVTYFISKVHKSADMLVHLILQSFLGFRDTAVHNGRWAALYKRAQILVADLWAALGGNGGMIEQTTVVKCCTTCTSTSSGLLLLL